MKLILNILFLKNKHILLVFCIAFCLQTKAQYFVNVETGAAFTGLNTIRNGSDGTFLSLKNDLESPVSPYVRLRFGYVLNEKHHFSILIAPLKLTVTGVLNSDVIFNSEIYEANSPLEAVYKFNSYRFTYNRRIINADTFNFGLGLSAKIRDAGTSLKNSKRYNEDFGTGFVPLINMIANWKITEKIGLDFFGEGLAASRGRAIDVAITGNYTFNKNLQGNIGYRILDGGSDGTNNYNFVQFHYAVISVTYQFNSF